jgi:hypothetical protein
MLRNSWKDEESLAFQDSALQRYMVNEAVDCVWNVMTHAQKPYFVFRQNGRVHLNRQGRQFSRILSAMVCASGVVMLDTTCSEVVWRVLATHKIRQFLLHFPSHASPCAITFQLDYTLHEDLCTVMTISRLILLIMRNVSDKSCRENQNTYFMVNN